MRNKIITILLLFLLSCSTQKQSIRFNQYEFLKSKKNLTQKEQEKLAFLYKLNGEYLKSYNLFKSIISKNKNNIKNLVFLNIINYLSEYCSFKKDINIFLNNLLTEVTNDYLTDNIKYQLMLNHITDNPEEVKKLQAQLGYINNFFILGPFKNENRTGMQKIYPPETSINFNKKYKKSTYHSIKWRKLDFNHFNCINLKNYLTPDENGIVYLLTYIQVTNSGNYNIIYGNNDGIKIWINNCLIVNEDIYKSSYFEQNRVKVFLKKGLNKILIKSSTEEGYWNLFFRILPLNYSISCNKKNESIFIKELSNTDYHVKHSFYNIENKFKKHFYKGMYYFITKNYQDNKRLDEYYFELSLKHEKDNPIYHYYYALAQKENSISMQYFLKSIQLQPSNIEARLQLIIHYYNLNYDDKVIEYAEQIEKLNNKFYLSKYYKALVFYHNNMFHQSLINFSKLEKNNINLFDSYYYMGQIYWELKDYSLAGKYLLKSFNQNPADFHLTYYNKLINFMVANNELEKIDNLINYALKYKGDCPYLSVSFSEFYLNRQELNKANYYITDSLRMDPYNPETLKIASDIMIDRGKTNKAIAFLQKIIESDIHNKNIKRRLQFLQGESFDIKQNYKPDIKKTLKKIFKKSNKEYQKKHKDISGIIFHDSEIVELSKSGTSEKLITKIYYILNDNGIKNFKSDTINYNPDFENVEIITAKTVYRDKQEFNAFNIKDYSHINEEEKVYYRYNCKTIHFPRVKKDSAIILQYFVWSKAETPLKRAYFGDITMAGHFFPVYKKDYIVILPENMRLYYYYKNFKSKPDLKIKKIQKKKIYKWKFKKSPVFIYDTPMPPIENIAPTLMVSTFNKWEQIGEWIWKLSEEGININDAMKKFIKNIKTKHPGQKEKMIKDIYNFIRDKIRYVGIEYGLGGIQPRNAIEVWTSRYGDCKDKALLLTVLLKELDIKAYLALVRTQDRGCENFELPLLGAFNHAVCMVSLNNKNLFLDATASFFDINEFPFFDRQNKIFIINPAHYKFLSPPSYKKNENKKVTILSNIIYNDHSMKSKIKNYHFGQFTPTLRYFSLDKENHIKNIESYWNSILPGCKLIDLNYYLDKNMFEYNMKADNILTQSENYYKFKPVTDKINFYQTYCTAKKKNYEIIFDFPYTLEKTLIYKLNFNVKNVLLPKDKLIKNKFLKYHIQYKKEDNNITVKRSFKLKTIKILPEDYSAFKKSCIEIDKWENKEIKIIIE